MRRASIFVFFLIVVVTSAMEWHEPYIRLTVNIPSDGEPIEATSFLRPTDEEEDNEQWTFVSDSIDACLIPGLTIHPMHSILTDNSPPVTFAIDPKAFTQIQQQTCFLDVYLTFDHSDRTKILLEVDAVSDWCTYNGPEYCTFGTCNNVTHSCDCDVNFYGPRCNTYCTANSTCSGHGSCANNGTCICEPNYYGERCDIYCDPLITCSDRGQCSGNGSCLCNENYFGYTCATFCNATTMCSGHGTCDFFGTGCDCDKTHWGAHCENECTCFNGHCNSTGQCACDENYFGEACNIPCTREDTCNNNGYCSDDGSCICFPLYLGSTCSVNKVILGISIGLAGLFAIIIGAYSVRECQRKRRYQQIQ